MLLMSSVCIAPAQPDPTFTKVTTGSIVTDQEGSVTGTWGDYDGDGWLDLYIANSTLSGSVLNSLYRNNRDGTFTKVPSNGWLATLGASVSAAWADIDNDGNQDLVVARTFSENHELLFNEGGGVFRPLKFTGLGQVLCPALADIDGDGWLDLFFSHYISSDGMYRNNADGTFRRLTALEAGDIVTDAKASYAVVPIDYDNDGDIDFYVGMSGTNSLYQNDGKGKFQHISPGSLATGGSGWTVHSVDYDNDGWPDLSVAGDGRKIALHRNVEGVTFTNVAAEAGLGWTPKAYDSAWGDVDNDGDLDFFVVNEFNTDNTYYRNNGDGTFTSVDIGSPIRGGNRDVGVNLVDIDNDGDLDLFIACGDAVPERNLLYQNDGNANNWFKVKLVGTASNRSGVGSKIYVTSTIRGQTVRQMRQISACGLGAGHGLIAHFGLGDATNIDLVRIEWPSGNVNELTNVSTNQMLTITEQTGITPARASASLGASVTFTSLNNLGNWQWCHNGVPLEGQTQKSLVLADLAAADAGRYSVVIDTGSGLVTNCAFLLVDTQFTKINTGPAVTDLGGTTLGGWGDIDDDGYPDLLVPRFNNARSAVYRNNRDGTFSTLTSAPFPAAAGPWVACGGADLDNDGRFDLVAGRLGQVSVYFNNGTEPFSEVQLLAGDLCHIAFLDYNRDGYLDLLHAGNWNWFSPGASYLWRNNGNRTFTRMNAPALYLATRTATCIDIDDDNFVEVFCAGDKSKLFHNDGSSLFVADPNAVFPSVGAAGAWGDSDNDGRVDLCLAGWTGPSYIYRNLGNGNFEQIALGGQTASDLFIAASWVDYNNDGFLDLFLSSGSGRNGLYRNNGDGTFNRVTTGSIANDLPKGGAGTWAGIWFDYNNNGFLDLYLLNNDINTATANTANFLYHNNTNNNAWLTVKLVGKVSNRDAVGAKVRVQAYYAGQLRWQRRDITGGDVMNGNNLYAHFGLGNATIVKTLKIEWPSGLVENFSNIATNQILTFSEPLRPVLNVAGVTAERCDGGLKGDPNQRYQILVADDILGPWTESTIVTTGADGCIEWCDMGPAPKGRRFYKAVKVQ
jgi:hypothetical protein